MDKTSIGSALQKGQLVVMAGPSAVGKSTIINRIRETIPDLYFSVSMTTRDPRPGEEHGVHYFFVSREEFDDAIAHDRMLEWADIYNGLQRSGTPRQPVEEALAAGRPVLVEVDLEGVRQIVKATDLATTVFIAPPSWDELERRLVGRNTETAEVVQRRLSTARVEMAAQDEFDSVIVNDDLDAAVRRVADMLSPDH